MSKNTTNDDASSDADSDGWGLEELPDLPVRASTEDASAGGNESNEETRDHQSSVRTSQEEDEWLVPSTGTVLKQEQQGESSCYPLKLQKKDVEGQPMILVDVTMFNDKIHSRFDRNSVNDPVGASDFRKMIETNYASYSKNSQYLSEGKIIPCGSTVWRDALVRLRDERPGHYLLPIFPPK